MTEMLRENDSTDDDDVSNTTHNKLLAAVSQLYQKQRIDAPKRSEPNVEISEFHLSSDKKGKKNQNHIFVKDLARVLNKRATHREIGKKIRAIEGKSKPLPKPVEKFHANKITRIVGYTNLKREFTKWDAIVHRNRAAEQLRFPLKEEEVKVYDKYDFLSTFKKPTELELEVASILNASKVAQEESKIEEELFPLSIEEMVERRKMMARVRAQESYRIAKASKQNKIKSKKYHRILRQEKIKNELKEFEKLQKSDPEKALEKLKELERLRAEERATLRHRTTGKWARSKAIIAKYDKEARIELAEQLAKGRELTQKLKIQSSSEGEDNSGSEDNIENNQDHPVSEVDNFIDGFRKFWAGKNKEINEKSSCSQEKVETLNDSSNINSTAELHQENNLPSSVNGPLEKINCNNEETDFINMNETINGCKDINEIANELKLQHQGIKETNRKNESKSENVCLVTEKGNGTIQGNAIVNKGITLLNNILNIGENISQIENISADSSLCYKSGPHKSTYLDLKNSVKKVDLNSTQQKMLGKDELESENSKFVQKFPGELKENESFSQNDSSDFHRSDSQESFQNAFNNIKNSEHTEKKIEEFTSYTNHVTANDEVNFFPENTVKDVELRIQSDNFILNKFSQDSKKCVQNFKGNCFYVTNQSVISERKKKTQSYQPGKGNFKISLLKDEKYKKIINKTIFKTKGNSEKITNLSGNWYVTTFKVSEGKEDDKIISPLQKEKSDIYNLSIDEIFKGVHDHISGRSEEKLKKLCTELNEKEESDDEIEEEIEKYEHDLSMKKMKLRSDIDEAMIELAEDRISNVSVLDPKKLLDLSKGDNKDKKEPEIDPKQFLSVKPKHIMSQIPDICSRGEEGLDDEDEDEADGKTKQMDLIEAFAEDDIIDEFRKEKAEEVKESNPKPIDLGLPGWGSWAGAGVSPEKTKRRKRRFLIKMPTQIRKDKNKDNVIISEEVNPKMKEHLVSEVPYPFTSVKDYEAYVRAPIGINWVPQLAHKRLVARPVVTKMGTIIEPMDEKQLVDRRKKLKKKKT